MNQQRAESSWLADLPIQRKLALAFAAVLLIFVLACAVIISALAGQARAHDAQQHAVATIDAAQNARAAMHRLETALYERLADDVEAKARSRARATMRSWRRARSRPSSATATGRHARSNQCSTNLPRFRRTRRAWPHCTRSRNASARRIGAKAGRWNIC
jgi:hypothetical protein